MHTPSKQNFTTSNESNPDSQVFLQTGETVHNHASFWTLASLGSPEARSKSLELSLTNHPSPQPRTITYDHVLCFGFLYYISAHHTWEWKLNYPPAWRFVGQHMRWTASM
ncbi:uncharacterized protein F5891DRAFT_45097 [Suillus fuscotomentosus]|uniref:Uncharacterized protein n=1 Tax=Suillus fuscotomentosus TaxID=1912939 RepID=A0AAD4HR39_9AGAM|nr:uncharacterized protein F5891DRAFT_45097 [Suillus fuscotomentosus]KAG1904454.1 hypothetical protein F5891DRAFT_45097 [Suillus fuscotomentosus]